MSSKYAHTHILVTSLDQNLSIVNNVYILGILVHFDTEIYAWRLVIIQNLYKF